MVETTGSRSQTTRVASPIENGFSEARILRRRVEDSRRGELITKKEKTDAQPDVLAGHPPTVCEAGYYFFRRLLSISRAPDSRATALAAELPGISGTEVAFAAVIAP